MGYWNVDGISLYYAFITLNGKLFGSKYFSVVFEDWVQLHYTETMEEAVIPVSTHQIHPIPGIDISAAGPLLVKRTIKQILLPQNGKRGNLEKGFFILCINLWFYL